MERRGSIIKNKTDHDKGKMGKDGEIEKGIKKGSGKKEKKDKERENNHKMSENAKLKSSEEERTFKEGARRGKRERERIGRRKKAHSRHLGKKRLVLCDASKSLGRGVEGEGGRGRGKE